MGEKGIAGGLEVASIGAAAAGEGLIERTTVTATTTVVGAGQDVVDAIRDKAVGAVADGVVDAGRERLRKDDTPDPPPATPAG